MAEIKASEGQHWYNIHTAEPVYEMIGANGNTRPVTLRDAKKRKDLCPGTTGIISQTWEQGLIDWMINNAILSALTHPKIEGESEEDTIKRIKADAKEQARKARELGTQVHAWVQQGFEGKELPHEGEVYFLVAKEFVHPVNNWECEKTFVGGTLSSGFFGGKVDLCNPQYIIDFKTSDKPITLLTKTWPSHAMQLSAYRDGLGYREARCGILYISTSDIKANLVWVEEEELVKGLKKFNALKSYWYANSGL